MPQVSRTKCGPAGFQRGTEHCTGRRYGLVWSVQLINLKPNFRRRENCEEQFKALGVQFKRSEGTNGWMMSEGEVTRVYDKVKNRRWARRPLTAPEIGCYLSHIECWRRVAEGTQEGGFVFEDDFLAADNLRIVLSLLSVEHRDWDVIKLFTLDPTARCISRRPMGAAHEVVIPYRVPSCALGYGITREAARRLVEEATPFYRPVDEDQKFFWEKGLRVALVLPAPLRVGDQQARTGTVGSSRRAARGQFHGWARFQGALRGALYQLRYTALLHYHRRCRRVR